MPTNLGKPVFVNVDKKDGADSKKHESIMTKTDNVDEEGPVFAPNNERINSHAAGDKSDRSLNSRLDDSENLEASQTNMAPFDVSVNGPAQPNDSRLKIKSLDLTKINRDHDPS